MFDSRSAAATVASSNNRTQPSCPSLLAGPDSDTKLTSSEIETILRIIGIQILKFVHEGRSRYEKVNGDNP